MATILLLGLENDLADQLSGVLRKLDHEVETSASIQSAIPRRGIDMIFVGGDGPDYRRTVRRLTNSRPDLPVIIVNRLPDNTRWLDALELGAADYCGAPFETRQVHWLVDSVRRRAATPVVAAA